MKKYFSGLLILVCAFFSTTAQPIKKIDGSVISTDSLTKKIEYLMKAANVSGACVAVFNNNKPVFKQAFGLANVLEKKPFTTTQVLYAASFAKAVFGYIAAQLIEEKVIDPDKPLVQYLHKPLPDYKIAGFRRGYHDLKEDKRYEKITARMCLNHTTGFPNWRWFEADKKLKIKFEPGNRYSYSGEGIYLLQFVIEQVTKKSLETLANERVFVPFNMPNTSFVWQEKFNSDLVVGHNAKGEPYKIFKWPEASAGGSMSTTFNDYTNFFSALMQKKGLKTATFNEMIRPQIRIKSKAQFGPNAWVDSTQNDAIQLSYGWALGLMKTPYGRAFFKEGHDEGWGHYSIAFPDKGTGIIIMTNSDNGESIFKELLAYAIGDTFTPWQWENYVPFR